MAMTTHPVNVTSESTPTYNISGSCLWTVATLVPLTILLVLLAL